MRTGRGAIEASRQSFRARVPALGMTGLRLRCCAQGAEAAADPRGPAPQTKEVVGCGGCLGGVGSLLGLTSPLATSRELGMTTSGRTGFLRSLNNKHNKMMRAGRAVGAIAAHGGNLRASAESLFEIRVRSCRYPHRPGRDAGVASDVSFRAPSAIQFGRVRSGRPVFNAARGERRRPGRAGWSACRS